MVRTTPEFAWRSWRSWEAWKTALSAKEKLDGYTAQQRFFLGYAQIWCQNQRPESLRNSVRTNPHSPGEFRVNGVVQNVPEFSSAFGCSAGQPMVSAECLQGLVAVPCPSADYTGAWLFRSSCRCCYWVSCQACLFLDRPAAWIWARSIVP